MSVPMKTPHTNRVIQVTIEGKKRSLYLVPKEKAESLETLLKEYRMDDFISAEEVLKDIHGKFGKAGSCLKGYRIRENLTQEQLAKKLGCPQSWVAGWESGSRPLGKNWARKIAVFFKTDPRVFL